MSSGWAAAAGKLAYGSAQRGRRRVDDDLTRPELGGAR
jgi:hypothetical protein